MSIPSSWTSFIIPDVTLLRMSTISLCTLIFPLSGTCFITLVWTALFTSKVIFQPWSFSHRSSQTTANIVSYVSHLLSLKFSLFVLGWWLKASGAWFNLPDQYLISKSKRASLLSHQIWAVHNLLSLIYASGLLSVYIVNLEPKK